MTRLAELPKGYKICKKCGEAFRANSSIQKYCIKCTTIKCKQCGKEVRYAVYSKFCSQACYFENLKTRPKKYKTIEEQRKARIERNKARRRKKGVLELGSQENKENISRLTKLAMQRPEVQEKIRQPKGAQTLEQRMATSNAMAGKMPANLMYDNSGYGNIQRGYYDINGTTMYFRSKWEANYALYLDFLIDCKEIYKWEFEPDTFMFEAIKLGTRSYTPDFKVYTTEEDFEYHEVKGYMDSRSKTKLKRFAKYYPDLKLLLIDSDQYNAIKKQVGPMLNFY